MRYLGPLRDNGIAVRCPWVEGVPLYYYGHSFTMFPAPYNTPYTGETGPRVQKMLGFGQGFFRGRSGTPLVDQIPMMLNDSIAGPNGESGSRRWTPGDKGVVLAQHYMNELGGISHSDPAYMNHWKQSLRTEFALMGSSSVLGVEGATKSGTWTKLVTGSEWFWNNECYFSSTVGSKIGFVVPSGDECWLLVANSSSGYNTGAIQVQVGSTPINHSTITTQGKMSAFTSVHAGSPTRSYAAAAYKITGLNAMAGTTGAKSVWLAVTEAKNTFVSACIIPGQKPPRIFYGFEPPRAGLAPADDTARRAVFKSAAEEVIAEFPYATGVDLAPGWDPATMVGSLDTGANFHPGDYGMQHIAARYAEAIVASIKGPIDGVQVN